MSAAKKRIAELETELKVARRAVDVLKEQTDPKGGTRRSRCSPRKDCPPKSLAGYWPSRRPASTRRESAPSERSIRHSMLTDLITQIHTECHGIYGAPRVHAELTIGRGIQVGHG